MERDGLTPEQRFTRLFDAQHVAVRAYAWRRGADSADDVVAETFTIAWRRFDSVPAEPLPWLIGIARNVRRNMDRGERRRRLHELRSTETAGARSQEEPELVGAVQERALLRAALGRVSESDRELLLLAAWEGLDNPALATVLGCSRTAVAVRLHRARKRLSAVLADLEGRQEQPLGPCHDPEGGVVDEL